ncbi:SPOR domain-containing protein [Allorhizobium undicola]|uniref:SPOR domain-containing protein n=1 Tax=Allorhizobium undicola TaxID=78527 RepID=UPI003D35500E
MVQKQAAYSRGSAGNGFAEGDPLAELARLVGYEAPSVRHGELKEARPASVETVDLQDDLLQELDEFELPDMGDRSQSGQPYGHQLPSDRGGAPGHVYAPIAEPVSFGETEPADEGLLANEVEWSVGDAEPVVEPASRSGGSDPLNGYGRHRLPLANFNPVRQLTPQRQEPRLEPSVPPEPALRREPEFVAAPVTAIPAEAFAEREADFDFGFSPEAEAEPVMRPVAARPIVETASLVYPDAPIAPVRREVPSFFEELAQADTQPVAPRPVLHASPQPAAVAAAAAMAAPVMAAAPSPVATAPVAAAPVAASDDDVDLFGEGFELELDDIELDLAELAAVPADVAPAAAAPADEQVVPEDHLPFDATEIADQDDQLEHLAHLEVPELPKVEEEVPPAGLSQEFDFDIDAELATLLEQKVDQATRPVQAGASVAAQAAPVSAAAAIAVPPMVQQVRAMPSEDFDVFEKALEEDFRRSLDGPNSFGTRPHAAAAPLEEVEFDEDDFPEEQNPSRRWVMVAAAAAVVLVAGGGALAWKFVGGAEGIGSDEPKIVMADKNPVKVVPVDPGGKSVPNQDKAVYDRVAGANTDQPTQKNLISSDEEPMDVAQRTLGPDNLPMENEAEDDAGNPDAAAQAQNGTAATNAAPAQNQTQGQGQAQGQAQGQTQADPSLQPRKVKTMIVRPDGSLVAQETAAPANAGQPATAQQSALAAPSTQAPAPSPASQAGAVQTVPTPRPAAVQTAAAQPVKPTAQPAAMPAATPVSQASSAAGGYVVQISSLPTEADAKKSYQTLSTKFASVIGGKGVDIKAADIPGKGTYYRVRIPAGDKAGAVALCEKYRAAGGTCMAVPR